MHIDVRYFASVREKLGSGQTVVFTDPRSAPATVGALLDHLAGLSQEHAEALSADKALRMAMDQVFCAADAALHDGAEVAFFPPVTGG